MSTQSLKFTKSALSNLIKSGLCLTVKDTEITGLKFTIGPKRKSFVFEKRIVGSKKAAVTIRLGSFPAISVEEARIEAYRLANLCEQGIDPRKPRQSCQKDSPVVLQVLIERFFKEKAEKKETTLQQYRDIFAYLPQEWLALHWDEITSEMIAQQFHKIRVSRKARCWKMISLFNNLFNTCSPLFKYHDGQKMMKSNPIPEVRAILKSVKPHIPKRPVVPVHLLGKTIAYLEDLRLGGELMPRYQKSPGPRTFSELLLLAFFTGFRLNELQSLKWSWVDLERGFITLPRSDTKNGRGHVAPLSSYPWQMLQEINEQRGSVSSYVFPSVKTNGKMKTNYSNFNQRLSEALGTQISPHTVRRTFASIAHEIDISILAIKRMLNHHYVGGVTGGYVVKSFNPEKQRANFQSVCDYILDRRAEYLGESREPTISDQVKALRELECLASRLGLDLETALSLISKQKAA